MQALTTIGSYFWGSSATATPTSPNSKSDAKSVNTDSKTGQSDDGSKLLEELTISTSRKSIEGADVPTSPVIKSGDYKEKTKTSELKFSEGLIPQTTLKCLSDTVTANCWAEPDALAFKIRGPDYLEDKVKISSSAAYTLIGVDLYKCEALPEHIATRKDNFVTRLRENALKLDEKPPFVFLVNFLLPWGAFVCYWSPGKSTATIGNKSFDKLITDFINGTDEYRNQRWKFIPRMIEGNWGIKKTIGENTPVIISKRITHKYFKGEGYFEIDCDITSSKVARGILGMVQAYVNRVVLDMVVLIEGQAEDELPEKILGGVRFVKLDPESAPKLPVPTVLKRTASTRNESSTQASEEAKSQKSDD
jgi:hypothetical protein